MVPIYLISMTEHLEDVISDEFATNLLDIRQIVKKSMYGISFVAVDFQTGTANLYDDDGDYERTLYLHKFQPAGTSE